MCRKLCFFISFIVLCSPVRSTNAATVYNYLWTNASGDGMWNNSANWKRSASWMSPPVWSNTTVLPEKLTADTSGQIWLTPGSPNPAVTDIPRNPSVRLMPVTIPAGYDADCGSKADSYQTIYGPEGGVHLDIYGKLSVRWTIAPVQIMEGLIDANDPNDLLPPEDPNRSVINMFDGSEMYGPWESEGTLGGNRCETICLGLSWWMALPYVTMNMYGDSVVYALSLHLGGHLNMYGGTMDITDYVLVGTRDTWTVPDNQIRIDIYKGKLILPADYTDTVNDWIARGIVKAYGMTPGLPGGSQIIIDTTTTPGRTIVTAIPETPPEASNPNPVNSATDVKRDPILSWRAGRYAAMHDIYFGTDFNDVNNADVSATGIYKGRQSEPNYAPGTLEFNTSYYWRVDEVNDIHPDKLWKGSVWSFTTGSFLVVDDFEDYDDGSNRIYDTWSDYFVNNTGMTVGHLDPPFAERNIVHTGRQSMYMRYDNDGTINEGTSYEKTGTLFYSETDRSWETPQDWTRMGADSLSLWFRGISASAGSFTAGPPITMTAAGADIWGTSDQFHYAYKRLSSSGSITAKVVNMTNTHNSAKAGVMIRESLEPGAVHAMVDIQPLNEVQLIYRNMTGGDSTAVGQSEVSTPIWVKLTRSSNTLTGEYSVNGATWQTLGTVTLPMSIDIYIGLIVCSHNVSATCEAEFSDVATTGTVTGNWQSQDIGIESNIPEQLYVLLQDSAGNSMVVKHPDPAASAIDIWTQWNIPLADFAGVNPQTINKMAIGVGDRVNPQYGGAGDLYIDDIRLYIP
jgi:regulation of enolase protein 1 (concanavalin A-like superfamily)